MRFETFQDPVTMASDNFSKEVTDKAVMAVMKATGFDSVEPSALDILTQLSLNHAEALGALAKEQADMNCRTLVNLQDIMAALRLLRPRTGFEAQASVEGLIAFAVDPETTEASLSVEVASFPARPNNTVELPTAVKGSQGDDASSNPDRGGHIPAFAPPLPPAYTYKHTAVDAVHREDDPRSTFSKLISEEEMAICGDNAILHWFCVLTCCHFNEWMLTVREFCGPSASSTDRSFVRGGVEVGWMDGSISSLVL